MMEWIMSFLHGMMDLNKSKAMLSNIKLIGVIVLSVLLLTNCKKEDKIVDRGQGEVVFTPNQSTNIDKSDGSNCELPASYAFVVVNGMDYNLPVFCFKRIGRRCDS